MSDSVFLVLDFSAICRLCLSARGRLLTDIFNSEDETENAVDLPPLHDQISLITGVKISPSDKLPQQICYKCRHLVDMCYELRDSAERAHSLLTTAANDLTQITHKEKLEDNTKIEEIMEEYLEPQSPDEDLADPGVHINDDKCTTQAHLEPGKKIMKKTSSKKYSKGKYIRKRFICEICLTRFPSKEKMSNHIVQHYENSDLTPYLELKSPYRCERCDQTLKSRKLLVQHHLKHLNLNPFVCRHAGCSFVGKSKETLRHHGYKHNKPTLVCETCGASFRRSFSLKQHMIRHADKGARFPCRQCGVVCANRLSYSAHLQTHERPRRYKCERTGCPKAYFNRADLVHHTRSHDNERIYRCSLCVSSYISQSQLNRHLRQHQQRRVRKCDKCCSTFDNYTAFCNHRINTHGAWLPHKCIGCNQGYQSKERLEKHTARCKLALNVKNILKAEETSLALPSTQQEAESVRALLCSEESIDTLDSLLLRNLKSGPVIVEAADLSSVKSKNGEMAVLPPDGLLYIEVNDEELNMQPYPSPASSAHQHPVQQ